MAMRVGGGGGGGRSRIPARYDIRNSFINLKTSSCERQTLKHRYRHQMCVCSLITGRAVVIFVGPYFTFFTHCDYRTLSSHVKKTLFHSIYFMGLLIYHLGYQTEHIPTGFVSVAISGGFGENLANLTGLSSPLYRTQPHTD